jgi:EAL domain-containing protein (putative c-di-GMP-specific phosphodiesterase class I)/ActR/RegA family two-component response regulator
MHIKVVSDCDSASAGAPADRPACIPSTAFVIDDEGGICQVISMTLASLGIKPQCYASAQQAVAALEHSHPDIVFLDVALKGSDAIDVIRALGNDAYGGIVQLMSGTDARLLEDVRRIGERHGLNMRPPLAKPFKAEAIRRAVTTAPPDRGPETPRSHPLAIQLSLDEALVNGWVELWYQPKIDLRTNSLCGAEGLVRCRHPQYGVLTPGTFLPQASETGMSALTQYVVATALRDWAALLEAGANLRVAVNTTIGALTSLNLPSLVRELRPKTDTWPGLILEVTENEAIKDVALVHEIATQLSIYGIGLSIDDFGEGYSSFSRLRELPFRELKLDSSFVRGCAQDTKNAGICQSVIDLAHHFGTSAVAEGVENVLDLVAIRSMGCDIAQGFLFASPMPKSDFISEIGGRVRENRPWLT